MKRKFTFLMAALALLTFLIPLRGWGQTTTTENVTLSDGTFDTDHITWTCADGNISITQLKGSSSTAVNSSYISAPRVYKGHILSFVGTSTCKIKQIDITVSGNYYGNSMTAGTEVSNNTVTDNTTDVNRTWTSTSGGTHVVSSVSEDGLQAIYIQNVASTNVQLRFTALSITYITTGTQPTTYTVTYDGNGNDSGTVPTDNNQYTSGQSVTVLGNTGDLAKTGYTFNGWNTAADGSGTNYDPDDTFPISANTTLYAQWTENGGSNTGSITITQDAISGFTNSYAWYDWTANNISGKLYAYKNSGMQFNSSKDGYWVYNTTAIPGRITSITMTKASGTDRSWTLKVGNTTLTTTTDGTQMGDAQTVGTSGATWNVTGNYDHFLLYVSGGATVISSIVINYEVVTTPTISFDPTSLNLGNVAVGQEITETFTVSQANLTDGIALSASDGTLSPNSIEQGAAVTEVTWIYTPATAGAFSATVTATSGTLQETLAITGTAKAAHNITIANMTNGSVTASANSAVEGETITLTVTPATGYTLDALTVTNTTTNETVTVTNNTFEMPDAPVTVSATFTEIQAMTVAEAIAAIDAAQNNEVTGVYVAGTICQVDSYNSTYKSITYWISDDGETTTMLQVYSGLGLNGDPFSAITDLNVGDKVVVYGNLKKYNDTYEFNYNSQIISLIQVQTYILSLGTNDHINGFFMYAGNDNNNIEFVNGEVEVSAGTTVFVSVDGVEDCYVFNGLNVTYGNNQTVTITEIESHVYYSFVMPESNATLDFVTAEAQQYALTIGSLSHVTLEMTAGGSSAVVVSGGDVCEGVNVTVIATAESGYVIQTVNVVDENNDPVDIINQGNGVYSFTMPSSDATVSATAAEITLNTYTLATSITAGATYLITNGSDKAMGNNRGNNRAAVDADIDAGVVAVMSNNEDVYEFIIEEVSTGAKEDDKLYTIQDVRSSKYLCSGTSTSNYLKEQEELTDNGKWTISIDADGIATIVAQSGSRNYMRYNPNNGTPIFSCYASTSTIGSLPVLYKKNTDTPQSTNDVITAYGEVGGYAFIASPVIGAIPTAANGFLTNEYDLYYFDESQQDEEWRNYKVNSFNLVSGKGYLYANNGGGNNTTTLTFTGIPYNGNGIVALDYTEGKTFAGWNLIGNPYATAASVDKAYYRLNPAGSALKTETEDSNVAAMEGVFVKATAANETATFTAQSRGGEKNVIAKANINVTGANGSVIDNAIVRFDEGQTLEKFMFNENGTKVYFTEDHKDYAIVRSEARDEMPVNFKAAENGTYTINVATENLDVDYLHLIDNLTGMDVDLLATPTYTFESRKNDYASRFRLRFSANNNNNNSVSDEFAFVSNGEIVIMNEGEATLQVIDMLGRTVSTQAVDGNARIDKMNANGVYVLRLIDGNEVKTQKIVIE